MCRARAQVAAKLADKYALAVGRAVYDRLEYLIAAGRLASTPEGAELDVLAKIISDVEDKTFPK
jgi:hypothetical protein